MIARIVPPSTLDATYGRFLEALVAEGFSGEISTRHADRTVLATDNSIYQRLPQAVVFPVNGEDVQRLARVAGHADYRQVALTPRGGGTGTNGQSLTDGIVVDLSRHMNRILWIDAAARRVRVQAGVVKDQLNAALRPHGLFFAPELSTSNRATIGGMINTDASGQGSCTYGKTRDHVLALDAVLLGGERFESRPVTAAQLDALRTQPGRIGDAFRCAERIIDTHAELIAQRFPKLNRCLTGYDLAHLRTADGRLDLNSVLCGAEGSLGFIVEAELNVLPLPRHAVLVNVRYAGFMDALRDAQALMAHQPLSIETVDSKVLLLAMQDMVWDSVAPYFPRTPGAPDTRGINLVEFSGDDAAQVDSRVAAFVAHLQSDTSVQRLGHTLAAGHVAVEKVYAMRKRAVGLLGNVQGEVRPQPFVEDTAVPPEKLADYIGEFRALLDRHGLNYGMFGHVDAGVLHVRPALDLKVPAQAALMRVISDSVAELTQKYGGLLWGEHGKGVRSEYAPRFFGPLYPVLQQLKAAFDPHNQLNPGKIATPATLPSAQLLKIDGVPLRGELDRRISIPVWRSFDTAVHCNGNGACYNFDPDDLMCPSWKATRERRHSPKGRASLMREWLRLQEAAGVDILALERRPASFLSTLAQRWRDTLARKRGEADFSHEVYEAMAGCLACKSCAGQCPVKVNVPEFRSRFLALYHRRYLRPLRDYLIGSLEFTLPVAARIPTLYNRLLSATPVRSWLERRAGLVDSPLLHDLDLAPVLRRCKVETATPALLAALSPAERARSVILIQDAFTRWFDTPVLAALIELATRLGQRVFLAPYRAAGKPLQVHGFLDMFARVARRNARMLAGLADYSVPLVGLDPAMTLLYRQEYRKLPDPPPDFQVLLPQEWLAQVWPENEAFVRPRTDIRSDNEAFARPTADTRSENETFAKPAAGIPVESSISGNSPAFATVRDTARTYGLLAHCTEKATASASAGLWQIIFARAGLSLRQDAVGCCGMSGTYGHEARNRENSRNIFDLSWAPLLDSTTDVELLATGYSCRSQTSRLRHRTLRHPIQALLEAVSTPGGA